MLAGPVEKDQLKIVFILRGRPGLGHVMPGFAIAARMSDRNHAVHVITYGNGSRFLRSQDKICWTELRKASNYVDWPGLDTYDDGLRLAQLPVVEEADLVVLGGEYMLAPLAAMMSAPCALLFNPEIMEDNKRNAVAARLFSAFFSFCDHLIPMTPIDGRSLIPEFARLQVKFAPAGPFRLPTTQRKLEVDNSTTVLIGNGGGIDFPARLSSYSESANIPEEWIEQTRASTLASIEAAASALGPKDRIVVFSCLNDAENESIRRQWGADSRVRISSCSMEYYDVLSQSSVFISRAGLGGLSDVETFEGPAVIWALNGHDEQIANARALASKRPYTIVCNSAAEIREGLMYSIGIAKMGGLPSARNTNVSANRTAVIADYLEKVAM